MKLSLDIIEKNPQGVIIYHGPSQINGEDIIGVVTNLDRPSKNSKTGEMIQTYILPSNIRPTTAVYSGKDTSVCGDCIHRFKDGAGSCYVNPGHGPLGIFKAFESNTYPVSTPKDASKLVAGQLVRLGAYGDPAAIPLQVWDDLLSEAHGWTGYTHQWKRSYAKGFNKYCMASVETPKQRDIAKAAGWRTFRVRIDKNDKLMPGEFECPASDEQNHRLTCATCMACDGGNPNKVSPAIIVHGPHWKQIRLKNVLKLMRQKKKWKGIYDSTKL